MALFEPDTSNVASLTVLSTPVEGTPVPLPTGYWTRQFMAKTINGR